MKKLELIRRVMMLYLLPLHVSFEWVRMFRRLVVGKEEEG